MFQFAQMEVAVWWRQSNIGNNRGEILKTAKTFVYRRVKLNTSPGNCLLNLVCKLAFQVWHYRILQCDSFRHWWSPNLMLIFRWLVPLVRANHALLLWTKIASLESDVFLFNVCIVSFFPKMVGLEQFIILLFRGGIQIKNHRTVSK